MSSSLKLLRIFLVAAMVSSLASCSLYRNYQSSRPANILETEAKLEQAGFHRVAIETPVQNGAVMELPLDHLNRYQSASGSVYWYADPRICSCLYEGDQSAFDLYSGPIQQEQDLARYANESDPDQIASLGAFGNSFPSPFLWGGWPAVTYYRGYGGGGHGGGSGGPHWGHPGGHHRSGGGHGRR
jgi:hypothetical protein